MREQEDRDRFEFRSIKRSRVLKMKLLLVRFLHVPNIQRLSCFLIFLAFAWNPIVRLGLSGGSHKLESLRSQFATLDFPILLAWLVGCRWFFACLELRLNLTGFFIFSYRHLYSNKYTKPRVLHRLFSLVSF